MAQVESVPTDYIAPWPGSSDPLSRAVALHGLGKITIHEGEFAKGLAMFEESIATYPLPLTYRNLAVYWSSEGNADKAYGYVQKAMALVRTLDMDIELTFNNFRD